VRQLIRSDAAERDLEEILDYLNEHSPPAAERFVAELATRCQLLTTQPFIGRARDDLRAGLRSIVVGNYVVFFLPTDDQIQIRRVIHGARNITPGMFGGA
jgi:toxin ParE1/3/4